MFSFAFLSPYSAYFDVLSNFLGRFYRLALRFLLLVFSWSLGLLLFILFSLKTLSPQTWIITISSRGQSFSSVNIVALRVDQKLQNTENFCSTSTSPVWFPLKTQVANYLLTRLHIFLPTWSPCAMPNCVPAVRYTEARHSNMRTSLSSAGISWRTLMGYLSYAGNRACALPSPSPFHYVMAQIVPVVQLAAHAKSSNLYGRSYGLKSKFFRFDG